MDPKPWTSANVHFRMMQSTQKKSRNANDNLGKHSIQIPPGEGTLVAYFMSVIACQTAHWAVGAAATSVQLHRCGTQILQRTELTKPGGFQL